MYELIKTPIKLDSVCAYCDREIESLTGFSFSPRWLNAKVKEKEKEVEKLKHLVFHKFCGEFISTQGITKVSPRFVNQEEIDKLLK